MHTPLPAPGSTLWLRQQRWRVARASRDGQLIRLDLVGQGHRRAFVVPFDRPATVTASGRLRRVRRQRLAPRVAALAAETLGTRHLRSLLSAEADILPHQLAPALAILAGHRRVLVADEVGLGKTIQAALIVSELRARDVGLRALLLVPTSLQGQWMTELQERFGIALIAGDRLGLERSARETTPGSNPWRRSGIWIASLDYLKQPHVCDALPALAWDLVIVDEAHDACGASDRHAVCATLARLARRLVLLTATPHSGDADRFDRLMALGAAPGARRGRGAGGPTDTMLVFRRTRSALASLPARRVRWHVVRPTDAEARLLTALREFERFVMRRSSPFSRDVVLLFLSILRKRALSTSLALMRTLDRRLAWLEHPAHRTDGDWMQPPLDFGGADHDSEDMPALCADLGLDTSRERAWLGRLRQIAQDAARRSSKLTHLARLLRRTTEPLVVFTEFRDSLDGVVSVLPEGCAHALLHGGQSDPTRRAELSRFLNGNARVLVATDVAAQGLNLQSRARWVLSLELPWRPSRLEQRIGRVDRIGQRRIPHLSLLVSSHPMEASLLARLARQALVASQTLGASVLDVVNPSEHAVAAALLAEDPPLVALPSPRPSVVRLSHAFERPARRLAARLVVCRRLRRLWRGSLAHVHRPWASVSDISVGPTGVGGSARLILLASLVDEQEQLLEQHMLEVGVRGWEQGQLAGITSEACACVARFLRPRVRRLQARLLRIEGLEKLEAERQRDAARYASRITRAAATQPGLFTGRLVTELDRIALGRTPATTPAHGRSVDTSSLHGPADAGRSRVTMAPPRLVAILARRQRSPR